ncbi:Fatty acid desaturase [Novipirellula galeiformis]|uniref:Fatty acid desaturase n=1 Tax=Novipirellula galeiformis TaxID=2528004 RepID=A0A5C6C7Z5_9BACT|nr:fatty acid desaturase [Novipirellula galeiformis]TWU20272.1 Fatty acid desaturase [Novipirellula galeiformis]
MSANCIESDTAIESWQNSVAVGNEVRSSEEQHALDRELLIASREFAVEQRAKSWWHLGTTLLAVLFFASVAGLGHAWWLRSLASLLTGLTLVRMFILYHDYQHHAILKHSRLANWILSLYGNLMLTPPSAWKHSHDYHHHHNSKLFGVDIGSFPIMTTENYRKASWSDRLAYRISRHPLVILLGYFPVFLYGMCICTAQRDPRRHWDAFTSLLIHFGFIAGCVWFSGWTTTMFVFLLPTWIATCAGTYLFYIQHNFPDAKIRDGEEWSYTHAALQSSSFLDLGPVMHWMTGNIGYHHVHHLNAKIPFYRLPEAMRALPPLQAPRKTSLKLRDIIACLNLKLWDEEQDRLITYAEAKLS